MDAMLADCRAAVASTRERITTERAAIATAESELLRRAR
jgi:hypothetical protein